MTPKKLITSALPYVNNAPHLGNIIGCVLSADTFARYCRAKGYETLYICATDEYGTATENKARAEGLTPKEICDKYHAIHKTIYEHFNISFDYFGRTSHPEHIEVTQSIYKDLEKQNMIEELETEQTYCDHDQMFLADRYVIGICPHCGFDDARGDQCDKCGKLLQPTEIINPKCQICGNAPSSRSTKHLYIKLPKLENELKAFHKASIDKGKWTNNAITLTNGWLENGLIERPITRDLKWGIQVPREGYENKVFYVWFDAPIGYISTTKRALPDSWQDWWLNPDETELYQFMAKDNIPFHTVVFPACLIGTRQNWTLLHHINATEYLNYEKDKFSKSRSIGVFGTDVVNSNIPVDLWRFYLLFNRPEKSDSSFSWNTFLEDINSNFIDNIGNLLNRVLVFFDKHFGGEITPVEFDENQKQFLESIRQAEKNIVDLFESVKIKEALKSILAMGKVSNKFFQDEEPWSSIKSDAPKARSSLTALIYVLRDTGIMLAPYMPETSTRMLSMFGPDKVDFGLLGKWNDFEGRKLDKPQLLFKKLEKKTVDAYRDRFSGKQPEVKDPLKAWSQIQIKVGEIKSISVHPSADLLYVEEVDCGEESPRTIVSGLVKYYQRDELLGKKVLIVSNLAPANLRGVQSEGMLLTAEKKKKIEVIEVENAKPGDEVRLENETDFSSIAEITIDTFAEADLKVEDYHMRMNGQNLIVNGLPIKTRIVANGKVK
ncbi:methionine--tRNA ligase [bacterium]|nr:methionine--tRNA ligase [bacterium]